MTTPLYRTFAAVACFTNLALSSTAADLTAPIGGGDLVFTEEDGVLAIEAEHFYEQSLVEKRAWHITTGKKSTGCKP